MDNLQGDKPENRTSAGFPDFRTTGERKAYINERSAIAQETADRTERMLSAADQTGRVLIRMLMWLAFCLIAVQLLLRIDAARALISPLYKMEGRPVDARKVKDWQDTKEGSFLHNNR